MRTNQGGVCGGADVYGGVNEHGADDDDYGNDKKVIKFTLRDGYKAVVEVEEKHGGFTVYPER